jgi:hypothetical protein
VHAWLREQRHHKASRNADGHLFGRPCGRVDPLLRQHRARQHAQPVRDQRDQHGRPEQEAQGKVDRKHPRAM